MKIKTLMPILLLGLVACTTDNSSATSEGTLPSSTNSISESVSTTPSISSNTNNTSSVSVPTPPEPILITDWKETEKLVMTSYIGEVLPVAPFTDSYGFDYSEEYEQFCISDYVGNKVSAYGATLVTAGFTFEVTENSEDGYAASFYTKNIEGTNNQVVVEIDYYAPTGDANDDLLEIWGYVSYGWSNVTYDAMYETYGSIIVPFLTTDYEFYTEVDDSVGLLYVLGDSSTTSKSLEIGAALQAAGYTAAGSAVSNGVTYYDFYQRVSDDEVLYIEVGYFTGSGMGIFSWVVYSPLPTWSAEADVIIIDTVNLIYSNLSDYVQVVYDKDEYGTYYEFYDYDEEGLQEIVGGLFETSGFTFIESGSYTDGTPYSEYSLVISVDETIYAEIQSWAAEGEFAATLYIVIYVS